MSATTVNRLADETSPYLKQHAHNPVGWYPWGEEAFEKARREDKPIFLSIGYSACHWCHVMERESFENEEIARVLNEGFVSIKVDREERPDVDDVYMTCVQLTTGHGGWPLSAFLLPDRRPFFGGTYFPPEDRHGRVGFRTLLARISEAYSGRRAEIEETAARISEEVAGANRITERHAAAELDASFLDRLSAALARSFDSQRGGFGGAPKFPPHIALEWLLVRAARGDADALRMSTTTLDAMALGGIHDHLGGGFHRYSTDDRWLVPHFEKMLSDNGQLLALYARAYAVTGKPLYRRVAIAIGDYLLRDMRGPEGAFFAATDADSEGEEGKYFVFTEAEVSEVLAPEDAKFFAAIYQLRAHGNYRDEASGRATGANILHLVEEPTAEDEARLAPLRAKLLARRAQRVPPGLDDKRISGWNALAVSGLAIAAQALGEERFLAAAERTARFFLDTARDASRTLVRTWKDGEGKIPAFLEDEAYLANALLDLAESTSGARAEEWAAEARASVDSILRRFQRPGLPGFTFTGQGHEELLATGRDLFDKATPSGSGSATRALTRLALRTEDRALAATARAALQEVGGLLSRSPHGTETWHLALTDLFEFERRFGAVEAVQTTSRGEARSGALVVEAVASRAVARPGESIEVEVKVRIDEGFHLPADGGLSFEAWGGADLPLVSVDLAEPRPIAHEDGTGSAELGYEGEALARLGFTIGAEAARGERPIAILVRFRLCGEGVCQPEAVLSVAVPVTVRGAAA